jgi:hypothetical protein
LHCGCPIVLLVFHFNIFSIPNYLSVSKKCQRPKLGNWFSNLINLDFFENLTVQMERNTINQSLVPNFNQF